MNPNNPRPLLSLITELLVLGATILATVALGGGLLLVIFWVVFWR